MIMEVSQLNWITSFIWNIADDVLRDLYVRGKYRDVILPMVVIRRLDALLEPTHQAVQSMKASLDSVNVTNQDAPLRQASGQAFYNTSGFNLATLKNETNKQKLKDDFICYLDGFSPNVQEILENFEFRNQITRLHKADVIGTLIQKFLSPEINLSPNPILNADKTVLHAGLDNHAMGTIFEELVRRFNEENNEEAGEHWTPRDAVKLMANLLFLPIVDQIKDGTYELYDAACGTGGMLTVAEETLKDLAKQHNKAVVTHLYGQEINAETYAICKADLLIKGEGQEADNIKGGSDYSTIVNDAFRHRQFDFMLSNPPYGKSWKSDLEKLGGKDEITDNRFVINYKDEPNYSLVTRSSDGQMLFLANMVSKMRHDANNPLGSRIAQVHNGSSLFTGDAGQGESNIRRYIIENDWLEAIIALPLNLFYNTGIATYVWVLSNRKAEQRQGKVQLIDASQWFKPLRKNLGKKNCELSSDNINTICDAYLQFKESEQSKIFSNQAFGYWKVTIERPLRLHSQLTYQVVESIRFLSGDEALRQALYELYGDDLFNEFNKVKAKVEQWAKDWREESEDEENTKGLPEKIKKKLLDAKTWERDGRLYKAAEVLHTKLESALFTDYNLFKEQAQSTLEAFGIKLGKADLKTLLRAVSWRVEDAPPVIAKLYKPLKKAIEPLIGVYEIHMDGNPMWVEYEPDPELRDSEQIPLLEAGGITAFLQREVLPYTPDAWMDKSKTQIGYEISFTRYFYKPQPLRELAEIQADIKALERETDGLLDEIVG